MVHAHEIVVFKSNYRNYRNDTLPNVLSKSSSKLRASDRRGPKVAGARPASSTPTSREGVGCDSLKGHIYSRSSEESTTYLRWGSLHRKQPRVPRDAITMVCSLVTGP